MFCESFFFVKYQRCSIGVLWEFFCEISKVLYWCYVRVFFVKCQRCSIGVLWEFFLWNIKGVLLVFCECCQNISRGTQKAFQRGSVGVFPTHWKRLHRCIQFDPATVKGVPKGFCWRFLTTPWKRYVHITSCSATPIDT